MIWMRIRICIRVKMCIFFKQFCRSKICVWDPGSWKNLFQFPDLGRTKRHRIPDPDPQHCSYPYFLLECTKNGTLALSAFTVVLINIFQFLRYLKYIFGWYLHWWSLPASVGARGILVRIRIRTSDKWIWIRIRLLSSMTLRMSGWKTKKISIFFLITYQQAHYLQS